MAKGTKNYFRHSIFMHQDEKLSGLIERSGMSGFGRWCVLIELMAAQEIANEAGGIYVFRRSQLNRSLRLVERTLNSYLTIVEQELNVGLTIVEQVVTISYPKMLKYIGSYKTLPPLINKENKENKGKKENKSFFNFEEVWNEYPIKKGKKEAEQKFNSSVKSEQDFLDIKKSIVNYKKEIIEKGTEQKFIKHGSTFFNQWKDYLQEDQSVFEQQQDETLKRLGLPNGN